MKWFVSILLAISLLSCSNATSSSESISHQPSSPSSSRTLDERYFYDDEGHWNEYKGDSSHEKVNYSKHTYGDWRQNGEGLIRTCAVCLHEESHFHTYEAGWTVDEDGHYHAATCGHDVKSEYSTHQNERLYRRGENTLIQVDRCETCGYETTKVLSNAADFEQSLQYRDLADGTLQISNIGDTWSSSVILYPSEIEGKQVTRLSIAQSLDGDYRPMEFATVFLPRSIQSWRMFLTPYPNVNLIYDGTLADWIAGPGNNLTVPYFTNFYLKNALGEYRLLKDLILPAGTRSLGAGAQFMGFTINSVICNDELESITGGFANCPNLKDVHLNEGLKTLNLNAFMVSAIEKLVFPSTLLNVTGTLIDCENLYEVVIPENMEASISVNAFNRCPRLVAIYDYRKNGGQDFNVYRPLLADYTNLTPVHFVKDQDYVLVLDGEELLLLDYYGKDLRIDIPMSFMDGDDVYSQFVIHKGFFHAPSISGGGPITDEEYAWIIHRSVILEVTVPLSVTKIEIGAIERGGSQLEKMYFQMDKAEMQKRLLEDFSLDSFPPDIYCLENGEYVPYPVSSKAD